MRGRTAYIGWRSRFSRKPRSSTTLCETRLGRGDHAGAAALLDREDAVPRSHVAWQQAEHQASVGASLPAGIASSSAHSAATCATSSSRAAPTSSRFVARSPPEITCRAIASSTPRIDATPRWTRSDDNVAIRHPPLAPPRSEPAPQDAPALAQLRDARPLVALVRLRILAGAEVHCRHAERREPRDVGPRLLRLDSGHARVAQRRHQRMRRVRRRGRRRDRSTRSAHARPPSASMSRCACSIDVSGENR